MRFNERSRPRPQRQEEYGDYVERDIDEGWPYSDDPGAFGSDVGNAPYGGPGANFDGPRNPGLHDAYDPVAGGGDRKKVGSSPPRRLRGDRRADARNPPRKGAARIHAPRRAHPRGRQRPADGRSPARPFRGGGHGHATAR